MSPSVASPEEHRKLISLGVHFRSCFRIFAICLVLQWIQFYASVFGDSGKKFPHVLRAFSMLVSTVVHVVRQFGCFRTYFTHSLRAGGYWILMSFCPALLLNGEVCTADASVACTSTWKSRHYIHEPLASGSHLSAVRAFPQKSFWEPSMTHICELSRARGWRGRWES